MLVLTRLVWREQEHKYVIAAAQYDGFQMGVNNGGMKNLWKNLDDKVKLEVEKKAYREAFAKQTRDELRTLPLEAGPVPRAVPPCAFSLYCPMPLFCIALGLRYATPGTDIEIGSTRIGLQYHVR